MEDFFTPHVISIQNQLLSIVSGNYEIRYA